MVAHLKTKPSWVNPSESFPWKITPPWRHVGNFTWCHHHNGLSLLFHMLSKLGRKSRSILKPCNGNKQDLGYFWIIDILPPKINTLVEFWWSFEYSTYLMLLPSYSIHKDISIQNIIHFFMFLEQNKSPCLIRFWN